jgi:hypothetical protein
VTSCGNNAIPPRAATPLLQIRRGYRTQWNNLSFSVEAGSNQWTLRVQDAARRETLYAAYRGGARAAQVAAAEFAIFRVLGHESQVSPDCLANELKWQEFW